MEYCKHAWVLNSCFHVCSGHGFGETRPKDQSCPFFSRRLSAHHRTRRGSMTFTRSRTWSWRWPTTLFTFWRRCWTSYSMVEYIAIFSVAQCFVYRSWLAEDTKSRRKACLSSGKKCSAGPKRILFSFHINQVVSHPSHTLDNTSLLLGRLFSALSKTSTFS